MFADLSYIVYLLHVPVMQVFSNLGRLGIGRLQLTGMTLVAVYLLSYLIWSFYDKPINELRSQWVASRRVLGTASVESLQVEPAG